MPALERLSVSKLSTYLLCPKLFRYRYIDQLPRERRSVDAAFGTAVHAAVGWWQQQRMQERQPAIEEAAAVFRADWTAEWCTGDLDFGTRTLGEWESMGTTLVALFTETIDRVPDEVDARFEVPLVRDGVELEIPLVGYMDYATGAVIGEIKTAARKTSPANYWLQLAGYSYAMQRQGINPSVDLVVLVKTKSPQIHRYQWSASDRDIDDFLEVAFCVHRAVEAGAFHPVPGWACKRCDHRDRCRGKT